MLIPPQTPRYLLPSLAVLALMSPLGGAFGQENDDPFAGIPNVSFKFYDVGGHDVGAIRASLNAHRPVDPSDGMHVDGKTQWHLSWRLLSDSQGCRSIGAPTFSATVDFPRLIDEGAVSPAIRARWDRYSAALRAHEAGHARYAYEHLGAVQSALVGKSCEEANAAGLAAIKVASEHDAVYDRETKHGATQGAVFP